MKTFLIYEHPLGYVKACRNGWSWGAALFSWIWAVANKLGSTAVIWLVVWLVLPIVAQSVVDLFRICLNDIAFIVNIFHLPFLYGGYMYEFERLLYPYGGMHLTPYLFYPVRILCSFLYFIVSGMIGNKFLVKALEKKGYHYAGAVAAINKDMAILSYMKSKETTKK